LAQGTSDATLKKRCVEILIGWHRNLSHEGIASAVLTLSKIGLLPRPQSVPTLSSLKKEAAEGTRIDGNGAEKRPISAPELGIGAGPTVGLRGGRYIISSEERSADGRHSWLLGEDTLAVARPGVKEASRVAVFVMSDMSDYLARVRAHTVLQCAHLARMIDHWEEGPEDPNGPPLSVGYVVIEAGSSTLESFLLEG